MIKKIGLRRIKRLLSVLLLLVMFLGAGLLPPIAHVTAKNSMVQGSPDARNLFEQGRKFYEAEQFAEAVAVWQQAEAAFKANGDELRQAITLGNLSLAYQQLARWAEAQQASTQNLNLLQTAQHIDTKERSQILAQALDIQGRLQLELSQAELALKTWKQAVDIYAQIGDGDAIVRNRINQAQALQALGLYRQAWKTLTETAQFLQTQPNSLLKVTGLRSLGNVLRATGNLQQSRQVLEQSLKVASSLSAPQAIADILLSLGNTARVQQDTQAAIKFYRQATNTATSPTTRINAQINQLRLLLETKQFQAFQALSSQIQTQIGDLSLSQTAVYARINFAENLTQFRQNTTTDTLSSLDIAQLLSTAVKQAQSLQDRRTESYALGVLGNLYEQTQQWSDAQNLTQKALLIAQSLNASDIAYRWQWQLGRLLKAQGDHKAAIASYTEAVNALQSLRRDLVAINPDIQFSFREGVEPVYRELVELLLRQTATSKPSQENLKQARRTIESLQLAELDNFFRSACLEARVEIDQVVDQDNTTAVVYPIILAKKLEIIVKLPNQGELRHYTTAIVQDKFEGTVASLRQYLLDVTQTSQVKKQSQQLYDWLIRPAEAQLASSGIKTLVFVLDGSLRNIPMAVLYDEQQQKYLAEKYALALTPGLQLVDPKPLQQVRLNVLAAGVGEKRSIEGREFAPLENVARELKRVQSVVTKSEELLNQKFTETKLQNELKSTPFSVVHLATHGEFSSNPEETFILTWDQLLKIKDFDNLLRLSDQRAGAIELLVLSACQTAQGDQRAALGLAGVAVRAGARSTLATLWSVDDQSTSELISQFYRELKTGVTKAEALQRAQLTVLKYEERPYFWAPYVLVGNWL